MCVADSIPGNAAVSANAAYFLQGEAFGVRQLAAAFKNAHNPWFSLLY